MTEGVIGALITTISDLDKPHGVVVSKRGNIIVAEWSGNCISVYNSNGEKVSSFGQEGSANGQLENPCGIAVDRAGNILVVEEANNHIQQFTEDGRFVQLVGSKDDPSQFNSPIGIGISSSGKV